MTHAPPTDDYDKVASDASEIRNWADCWGGKPVESVESQDPNVTLEFDGTVEKSGISWGECFERLDAESVALAYQTEPSGSSDGPPDYEFVQRVDTGEKRDRDPDDPAETRINDNDEEVTDRRSDVRERAAEKQENPDNHRDREPFQG